MRFVVFCVFVSLLGAQASWREWNSRGEQEFRDAAIAASIKSFDRAIQLEPRLAPHHWQRGISLYYAKRWTDCVRQFESHRTVNPEDVENAVWHYLCLAKIKGREEARKKLIPIQADGRPAMAQVHDLFAGKAKPEAVLAAAGANNDALFYAHLYLGLYWESMEDDRQARLHMEKAVRDYSAAHYMGDVARVHCSVRGWKPAP
ncbi:MAG: hypothetical protein R2762_10485 [Bryobacteraceae bacterium]